MLLFLAMIFLLLDLSIFWKQGSEIKKKQQIKMQQGLLLLMHFLGFLALFLHEQKQEILLLYLASLAFLAGVSLIYGFVYQHASMELVNQMCFLIMTGSIMLTRLSVEKEKRQLIFGAIALVISSFFPYILVKGKKQFRKGKWIYAGIGILFLAIVFVVGNVSYGAKISISIAGISIQPSEFVKISYIFFVAAMFEKKLKWKDFLITSGIAALHCLILAASKDFGTALIFFVIYVFLSYCATQRWEILSASFAFVVFGVYAGSKVLTHVAARVLAWRDPLSVVDNQGYQVCQSLFAIGTGGWFGTGLYEGSPTSIPVVAQDFIFSAIGEEMGVLYLFVLIAVCYFAFDSSIRLAMQLKDPFYRYVAEGIGICYGFQSFLTIGGCIKLIPSTGVTLPFVSYGGSSLMATFFMFALIEGLYIGQVHKKKKLEDEEVEYVDLQKQGRTRRKKENI